MSAERGNVDLWGCSCWDWKRLPSPGERDKRAVTEVWKRKRGLEETSVVREKWDAVTSPQRKGGDQRRLTFTGSYLDAALDKQTHMITLTQQKQKRCTEFGGTVEINHEYDITPSVLNVPAQTCVSWAVALLSLIQMQIAPFDIWMRCCLMFTAPACPLSSVVQLSCDWQEHVPDKTPTRILFSTRCTEGLLMIPLSLVNIPVDTVGSCWCRHLLSVPTHVKYNHLPSFLSCRIIRQQESGRGERL